MRAALQASRRLSASATPRVGAALRQRSTAAAASLAASWDRPFPSILVRNLLWPLLNIPGDKC